MANKIKIRLNERKDYVVITHGILNVISGSADEFTSSRPTIGSKLTEEISAILKDDGTITIKDLNNNTDLIVRADYTDFINNNNVNFATSSLETVDELNILFAGDPVTPPTITSATSLSGVAGTTASYQVEADNNPSYYDEENLPSSLFMNKISGLITGDYPSTSGSPYSFEIIANNRAGTDQKTVTLTTFTSGTYVNNTSTHFGQVAEKYAETSGSFTPSNMAVNEGSPWSISFWIKPDKNADMDIYYDGVPDDAVNGALRIYDDSNRISVQAYDVSGGLSEFETNSSVLAKDTWTHVMCAYDGTNNIGNKANWNIFIDGSSIGLTTVQSNYSAANGFAVTSSRMVRVARSDNTGSLFLDGNLDEIYVSSADKSSDISIFYNGGVPQDSSGEPNIEAYWRMGDQDTFPIISDKSLNGNDLRMINMVPGDFEPDVP